MNSGDDLAARVGVVIVAAGAGSRLGHGSPKAFAPLGERTILEACLEAVKGMSAPVQVIVVVPSTHLDAARELLGSRTTVVPGGETRQASVKAGLGALEPAVTIVLVHDAARPFTPTALFEQVIDEVRTSGDGVIPGIPVIDTLKAVARGFALETVDRSQLAAIQTPQGFPREQLVAAYSAAVTEYTDDGALYAAAGHRVRVVDGDIRGFKITTPGDLRTAELLWREVAPAPEGFRIGTGIDVHAYDETVPLWLGGLLWPDEPGLAGHSDGDAVSHAICDALLAAAGLGDIGGRFGTADPLFAGAHGDVFIRETRELLDGAGFGIRNVTVQVVGNHPRLAPRRDELESSLSELVGAPVSVSATTSDGLGLTGRGEGLAAYATALLTKLP